MHLGSIQPSKDGKPNALQNAFNAKKEMREAKCMVFLASREDDS
jgi:hypothetical protein